jgi:hypothetical protein
MPIIRILAQRFARLAAVGAVALTIGPIHATAASDGALDLAAALLFPDDVANAGFDDYGFANSHANSAEALASFAAADSDDPAAASRAIFDSGIESLYGLSLHPFQQPGASGVVQGVIIYSQIASYSDEDHAAEAFSTIEAGSGSLETTNDLPDPPDLGNESAVTEWTSDVPPGTGGSASLGFDVRFRIGRLTAMATVIGVQEDVDRAQAEELARLLAGKIEALLDGAKLDGFPAPGLSSALPRYEGESFYDTRADYQVYGGESVPNAYHLDISDNLQTSADNYGMIAQFYIGTQIIPSDASSDAHPFLIVRAARFSQASGATRYIEETVASLLNNPTPYDRVEQIPADETPTYGDFTSGYFYTYSVPDLGPSDGVAILFQQGRIVYELELEGVTAPDMTVVDAVVQDILDCAQERCETAVNEPDALTEYIDEQELLGKKSG